MPFNFPDPAVSTTATNPVTGATYQWKADPGKWVLAGGPSPGPDPDQERQDNEIDNIEQLQRELHSIVSDSVYFYPGFGLEGQLPNPGEYLPYEYTSDFDGAGIEKPTYFKSPAEEYESITHMRIAAVAGPNGHLELAEVGDIMYIQHEGTDAGGKYTITEVVAFSGGPDGYFEIKVDFIEGFSDGNIEHPGYDQIQVARKVPSARSPIFSDTEPTVHPDFIAPDNALVAGDIWYDITDVEQLIEYVHDGTQWILTGNYVKKKGGDSMEGPLEVTGPRNADIANGSILESTIKVLNVDSGENSSLHLKHNGNTRVYVGSTQTSFQGDIKFNASGSSLYTGADKKGFTLNNDGAFYDGDYTVDKHVATKKNIDDVNEALYQDIIELKEEINAIAPSLEYGAWKFGIPANASRPPSNGTFYLLDGVTYTDEYEKATGIAIHNNEYVAPGDTDPVDNHTWADADVGELIQLFDSADPDFFLGKITAKNVDTIGECVYFTVDRIQSSGVPNDNADPVTGEFLTRVNIFKEPTGGDAGEFVKKIGDTMTGELIIDKSASGTDVEGRLTIKGSRAAQTHSAATIKFLNAQSASDSGFLSYRSYGGQNWFTFNRDLDLNNNGLHSVGQIRMQSGAYIGSGINQRIKIRDGAGNQAGTEIQRVGDNKRTFAIRGRSSGSSTNIVDIFHAYGGTTSDGIYYTGTMSEANNIVTKAYVDSKSKSVDITCDATGKGVGDMWYCSTDGVLYLKVS